MEHSKGEESELEEGEISEDADDSKRNANKKDGASSTIAKNINSCQFSFNSNGPGTGNKPSLKGAENTHSKPINRKGKNTFFERVKASRFCRKREFYGGGCFRTGSSQSSSPLLRYGAKMTGNANRPNCLPRISSVPTRYRNTQRAIFHSNLNHQLDNADMDNDASYEDLLEQYRQIKCRLSDLNEQEAKQSDKGKSTEKSTKPDSLNLGSNKENWQQKQSRVQAKRWKGSSSCPVDEHKSVFKGKHSSFTSSRPIRRKRRQTTSAYAYRKQNRKFKTSEEKHRSKQCKRDNSKSANDEDDDLLELRKQALATLSKQSSTSCNKIKENCVETKDSENEVVKSQNIQNQNVTLFNYLDDNYEQVSMELDSDYSESSEVVVSSNKLPLDDTQFGDEIDEEELRNQLLQSLAGRKKQQEHELIAAEDTLSQEKVDENQADSTVVTSVSDAVPPGLDQLIRDARIHSEEFSVKNELSVPSVIPSVPSEEFTEKSNVPVDELPKSIMHNILAPPEPFVINLADDSSSEEESDKHQTPPTVPDKLPPGLEQLIKNVRSQSEKKQISAILSHKTPSAVQKLSKAQQIEYRQLKEEIAKRESGLKIENKDAATSCLPNAEKSDSKLIIAKSEINKEQERLQNLRKELSRKKFIARNSQVKVQKLKEELAAAERMLAVDMQMIKVSNAMGNRNKRSNYDISVNQRNRMRRRSTPETDHVKELRGTFYSPTDAFLSPCTQQLGKSHLSHLVPLRQTRKIFDERLKENVSQDSKGNHQ